MEAGVVDRIAHYAQEATSPTVVVVDGVARTKDKLVDARQAPYQPSCLRVATLSGLVDYVAKVADLDEASLLHILVEGPCSVTVGGPADPVFRGRSAWVAARHGVDAFPFDEWQDAEEFVIFLLGRFAPSAGRDKVLAMCGNLVGESVQTSADDGVTQTVATRQGVRIGETAVKNPVLLRPFRSFPEIEPVESPFIIRFRTQRDQPPAVALFECDGGKWATDTTAAIAAWLRSKLTIPVLA